MTGNDFETENELEDGFLERSRANAEASTTVRSRRISLCIGSVGAFIAVVLGVLIMTTGDAGKWGARRYAKAALALAQSRKRCDHGLRRKYLWRGPQSSKAMCVQHKDRSVLPPDPIEKGELRFLVIGDWGRDGMCCQRDVAREMDLAARDWKPQFVIGTGDNFYPAGIEHPRSEQVLTSWADVYLAQEYLGALRWMHVAGNHDHRGDVMAQVELNSTEERWHLPALRYYHHVPEADVFFAFVDTTPMYYLPDELGGFRTDMSDPGIIDEAVKELDAKLSASTARWKIVVGHHPLYSTGHHATKEHKNLELMRTRLKPVFEHHKIPAYFCGHEHSLEHAVSDGVHYFVSGAGSKIRVITNYFKENRFAAGRQGFMSVSIRKNEMRVYAVDMTGVVLHTAIVPLRT